MRNRRLHCQSKLEINLSVSLICRSDEHRSVWISLNFIPGDIVSQAASDGTTGCKDVLLMSSEMKFTIISEPAELEEKERLDKGYSTRLSAPTALIPHHWNENCWLQCLTKQRWFFRQQLFVCRERPLPSLMQTCYTKLNVMTFYSHLLHELCFNTAGGFFSFKFQEITRITHLKINEMCHRWCLKWLCEPILLQNNKKMILKKKGIYFVTFVHCVWKWLSMLLFKCHLWDTIPDKWECHKLTVLHIMW